jgi:hypothetical protein
MNFIFPRKWNDIIKHHLVDESSPFTYACWSSSIWNPSHDLEASKSKKTLATCKNLFCFLEDMVLIGVIWKSSSIDCIVSLSTLGYIMSNKEHLKNHIKIRMKNVTNAILNCRM